jgi:tartrate-resistant acid phosphatase type 5
VLALGDNFYNDGVTNVSDPRFTVTFEDAFNSPHLFADDHFRVVGGNHDHDGPANITAQIAYGRGVTVQVQV